MCSASYLTVLIKQQLFASENKPHCVKGEWGWVTFQENTEHSATTKANYCPLQSPHYTQTHMPLVTPAYLQEALPATA